jgi:hypothetical protein
MQVDSDAILVVVNTVDCKIKHQSQSADIENSAEFREQRNGGEGKPGAYRGWRTVSSGKTCTSSA